MITTSKKKWAVAAAVVAGVAALTIGIANAVQDDDGSLTGDDLDRAGEAALAEAGGGRVTGAEVDDDGGARYEVEVTLDDGTEVDVHLDDRFEVVSSDTDRDDDTDDRDGPLTGRTLERATESALAEAGGGRVTDSETDDGGYEVEVTLDDGTEVDVHLDRDFQVVATDRDRPGEDD